MADRYQLISLRFDENPLIITTLRITANLMTTIAYEGIICFCHPHKYDCFIARTNLLLGIMIIKSRLYVFLKHSYFPRFGIPSSYGAAVVLLFYSSLLGVLWLVGGTYFTCYSRHPSCSFQLPTKARGPDCVSAWLPLRLQAGIRHHQYFKHGAETNEESHKLK